MKKLLTLALVAGLVAVPSIALANNGADDTNQTADVRREDRRQSQLQDEDKKDDSSSHTQVTIPNQTSPIKVENEATLPEGGITLDQASDIAQGVFPGNTIVKIELENEHGIVVYSVRFSDNSRVDINALTGEVVRSRTQATNNGEERHVEDDHNESDHSDDSDHDRSDDDESEDD